MKNIYLCVNSFTEISLTPVIIEDILKKHVKQFSEEQLWCIYSFYGMGKKSLTLEQMALEKQTTYTQMHDQVFNLKNKLISLYVEKSGKENDLDVYIPYLENPQYELTPIMRNMLNMYILENNTYEDIHTKTSLSKSKISNTIRDGLRYLDFYRFGIDIPFLFSEKEFDSFLAKNRTYTSTEIEIIKCRYFKGQDVNIIHTLMGAKKVEIEQLLRKFKDQMLHFKANIRLTKRDLISEIKKASLDSVLSKEEKTLLSEWYGIDSIYNQEKKHIKKQENLSEYTNDWRFIRNRTNALFKIKLRKLGYLLPTFGIIPINQLENILLDPRLPLEKAEISFLKDITGIDVTVPLSEKEIMEKYQIAKASVFRKYKRDILNIKKYEVGELEPKLSYYEDLLPILKYFSVYENKFINCIYQENMTDYQIARIMNLSIDSTRTYIKNIKIDVLALLKKLPIARTYDFSYARSVLDKSDLPLTDYARELSIKIYKMYVGEDDYPKYSISQIKKILNLKNANTFILKTVYSVARSTVKYKQGYRNQTLVCDEDIQEYYDNYKADLSLSLKRKIERYLQKNKFVLGEEQYKISKDIVYAVLKEKNNLPFTFETASVGDIRLFLLEKGSKLSQKTKDTLQSYYHISSFSLMSGEEKRKIIRLLTPLYEEEKVRNHSLETLPKIKQLKNEV